MHYKTLTKQLLCWAGAKRLALVLTIVFSILCVAAAVLGLVVEDDELSQLGMVLFLVTSVLAFYVFFMVLLPISEIRDFNRTIAKLERALGIDFTNEMAKENIVYTGFRTKKYINNNWFIYDKVIIRKDYISSVYDFNTNGPTLNMIMRIIRFDGVEFRIVTSDRIRYEFIEWYYKVNPKDPIWKKPYSYDAKLDGRNIPAGWMEPKKPKRR